MYVCRQHSAGAVISRPEERHVLLCLDLLCSVFFHALHAIKDEASMSRMLQEYLVYETPWCTHNRAYLTNAQYFSLVAGGRSTPWLAMLRAPLTNTTGAYQLNRLRTAERPTSLLFTNDRCSLIYMNDWELSTFECCIHHAFGEELSLIHI